MTSSSEDHSKTVGDAAAGGSADLPVPPSSSLDEALRQRGIELPASQVELLDRYCRLLWDRNAVLNLTRHTTYDRFVERDVVDSMQVAAALEPGERVLDVGTGGGVPGVLLAILRPDLHVTLSDSVAKKARAVSEIVADLGLSIEVVHVAAQEHLGSDWYDTLVVRAVARMDKLLRWFKPHWAHFGRLLLIKGPAWVEERGEARHLGLMHSLDLRKLASYPMPGTDSESVLLEIRPKATG